MDPNVQRSALDDNDPESPKHTPPRALRSMRAAKVPRGNDGSPLTLRERYIIDGGRRAAVSTAASMEAHPPTLSGSAESVATERTPIKTQEGQSGGDRSELHGPNHARPEAVSPYH